MQKSKSIFIPKAFAPQQQAQAPPSKLDNKDPSVEGEGASKPKDDEYLSENVLSHINSTIEKLVKPYEIFPSEDIRPDLFALVTALEAKMEDCIRRNGDTITGPLRLLTQPAANFDVTNKEYVDWIYSIVNTRLDSKWDRNADIDMNHFKIKNIQTPQELHDAATKAYVDEKVELINNLHTIPTHHLWSKATLVGKKTWFFHPGFICPQTLHLSAIGFSTSPNKYKIGEKTKFGELNPTRLYVVVNQEIRSEHVVEKDVQIGYILKRFETPIVLEEGCNFRLMTESCLPDASVNVSFY
ncbi:hypothetical protein MIV125R [Invertebrate iridescent virus 3]|uniref:Uncharacterized protein 125R n=1 Tax=Invertebrate iridescent virus 3 TaxID=345201 RepID=125R_IIV3|nr:hypothetical protein MIV125R [Invertebrate iridescent virus 3]Q196T5.1 RecName: Full=Uncharacterized protein 125R [Invertebrate iridescent virus 3]ABF82155.1 hypothetical protein MIV125R [Invertebrate iridescent virus 3]